MVSEIGVDKIQVELSLDESYLPWLTSLAVVPVEAPAPLPDADELEPLCRQLGIPDYAIAELPGVIEEVEHNAAIRWLLDRSVAALGAARGSLSRLEPRPPMLPRTLGAVGRYFHLLVYLASVPGMRQYHQLRSIPEDVSWTTLADVGRHIGIHRRVHGDGGLQHAGWFGLHQLGLLYELGRLQFGRSRLSEDWQNDAAPFGAGEFVLDVHIPESGPLRPQDCIESFDRAGAFFREYFPDEPYRYAICRSWLLDDQLADYLPAESNMIKFQHMFVPLGMPAVADHDVLYFVFRVENEEIRLDGLPQETTLERAVVAHLRAGRHWKVVTGYVKL